MAYGVDKADVYANLICDYEDNIIQRLGANTDTILRNFPHRDEINDDEFTSISTETDNERKSGLFIRILLRMRREHMLEAFLHSVTGGDYSDILWIYLKERLDKYQELLGKKDYA
ncbi:uncharacterized protein LOC124141000 [Haliotis rufescens]|uniref:uncharacterized protein LOC124141000 n=1 Tax=Haliotis rufescens TaxID=6454 RepID=UPI001EAF9339|nr:uncharacterized protein LOC124141000 [Haliotis rufescens]XP_048259710.1 uncharacterized protein LOC124141000 [Haliotis rufescens]